MWKPFSLIFFIAIMVWAGSIMLTTSAQGRIEKTCVPLSYMGRISSSTMSLMDDGWGEATREFFSKIHNGCRYVVWDTFYADEWNRYVKQNPEAGDDASGEGERRSAMKTVKADEKQDSGRN